MLQTGFKIVRQGAQTGQTGHTRPTFQGVQVATQRARKTVVFRRRLPVRHQLLQLLHQIASFFQENIQQFRLDVAAVFEDTSSNGRRFRSQYRFFERGTSLNSVSNL